MADDDVDPVSENVAAIAYEMGGSDKRDAAYDNALKNSDGFVEFFQVAARAGKVLEEVQVEKGYAPGEDYEWYETVESISEAILDYMIEEKASGISIRQQLAEENILTHGYNPGNEDKLTRLHYVSPMFAAGRVWAVESDINPGNFKTWADPLVSQVCSYVGPGSIERDDLLDTSTQALRLLMDKFFGPFTVVDRVEDRERARAREIAERRLSKKDSPYG